MNNYIFITGIGTGVGKTLVSAIVTEALQADYWKPIQSGLVDGTDTATVQALLSNPLSVCHEEAYRLQEPASPHLAARMENVVIDTSRIVARAAALQPRNRMLVIEGAGGLMAPVNDQQFTIDLIRELEARVIIVSQNYLGSINHSMLTARMLQHTGVPVIGWVFSGAHHSNEEEIVQWSGIPRIGRVPQAAAVDKAFVREQAQLLSASLNSSLS
ncbi:dethiobiotin synthase [Chitinophaga vietnamensis]|uniref:dethiobiotin synthase n=1 Tax=Chitinophaga vietnamensis TaxID=2593957 RepID=UPI00117857EA|nr:dethiobiotin synthase [Chitinophaga vietnamensis]